MRLGVKGGGCSGMSYSVGFDARPRERDNIFTFEDVRVFIDPKSFVYLQGMTLDYEETLIRQGFNFINPNSASLLRMRVVVFRLALLRGKSHQDKLSS